MIELSANFEDVAKKEMRKHVDTLVAEITSRYNPSKVEDLESSAKENGIIVVKSDLVKIPSSMYEEGSWYLLAKQTVPADESVRRVLNFAFVHGFSHAMLDHKEDLYENEEAAEYFCGRLGYKKPSQFMINKILLQSQNHLREIIDLLKYQFFPSFSRCYDLQIINKNREGTQSIPLPAQ